jgi:CRISPR-associated endonuclease/helicase Cas3
MSYVELHFPFTGKTLTTDHGYALFGAISRIIPEVHAANWLAVSTLKGVARGDGTLQLDTASTLKVRLPQERVPLLLQLVGKRFDLDGHAIRLGAPQIHLLKPSSVLYARVATIKGYTEPEPFLGAVRRKLEDLNVKAEAVVGPRRVLKVGNQTVVGFALAVNGLSDEDSILLQERGVGGRRHMGCGIFFPIAIDRVIGEPPKRMQKAAQ